MRIVGKCMDMCPESEVKFRVDQNLLSVLEKIDERETPHSGAFDKVLCVKEFRRSAAGEQLNNPEHLRPAPVLLRTTTYLLTKITRRQDVPFAWVYDFVFDRLRSVRQDLTIQQIQACEPIIASQILEKCVRFYVYANFIIRKMAITTVDLHIHRTQTQHCLHSLLDIYRSRADTWLEDGSLKNAPEIISIYLLSNLGSDVVLGEVLSNFPREIRCASPMNISIALCFSYIHCNMVKICKCIKELKDCSETAVSLSLGDVLAACHTKALEILSCSHSSKTLTVDCHSLRSWLLVADADDVRRLCQNHGLIVNAESRVRFSKADFKKDPNRTVCLSLISTCNASSILHL